MKLCSIVLPLFLATSTMGYAQSSTNSDSTYLVFDSSKSLPGNITHDKIYFLMVNSHQFELGELENIVNQYDLNLEYADKIKSGWKAFLKVFINPNVKREDKEFVYNYLKNDMNAKYTSLIQIIDTHISYK